MGTRQLSQVIGTIQNMPRIDELVGIANNSGGAAMEAQLIWADSLEAKLQGLTNATQIFWQTFINSNGAKGFIDMLTGIVEGATKLTETFGSVGVAAGALSAIFIAFTNNPIKASLKSLSASLVSVAGSFIKTGTAGAAGGVMIETFTLANIKAKMAVIGTTIATTALQAVLTMGLSFAIMAVVGAVAGLVSKLSGANEELRRFNEETTKSSEDLKTQVNDVDKLNKQMTALENQIANSKSSTEQAQKKKELLDVQAKIAQILPESASGYDAEGRAIATNSREVQHLLDLKNKERVAKAYEFFEENRGIESTIRSYKSKTEEYEKMLEAKKKGIKYSKEYETSSSSLNNGNVEKRKIEYDVDSRSLVENQKELQATATLASQAKVHIDALRSDGMSDSQIAEELKIDIAVLEEYDAVLREAADSTGNLGDKSNDATGGLENIVVKLGDVTANAKDAAGNLDELGKSFSELGGKISLGEKALEEFNKHGGLTVETKEKILGSGDSALISFLADETTMAQNLNKYIKENKDLREKTEQAAIANAVADQEGQKYMDEKNRLAAEQNAKLDEQKGKIDEINQAQSEKKEETPPDYTADITAKTTAEQNKTTVVNDESSKRTTKLQEEADMQFPDAENKTLAEQLKTSSVIDQVNARIAESQRETTENQTSYTTDGTNFKTNEDKKVTDTQTTMSSISSTVSLGMSGLATHYTTNASNFATSLTSMEGSARTSVANINSILATIKQPTIKMPSVPSGGSGGGQSQGSPQTQSLEPAMFSLRSTPTPASDLIDEFRVSMREAISPRSEKGILESLPKTLMSNLLAPVTEEERRRGLNQLEDKVENGIERGMARAMVMSPATMMAASRATVTLKPGNIVPTVKPSGGKKPKPSPSKKPSTSKKTTTKKSSSSSSSKKSSGSSSKEKVDIKDIDDEIDRYKVLDDKINDVNHSLAMNNKLREHASAKNKYKYHYEEIKLLEQKKTAISNIQKEQKKEMAELEKKLKSNGFNPKDGNMSNYKTRLEQLKKQVNAMSNSNKAKEDAKKKYEDLKKAADRYFEVSKDLQKHKEEWQDVTNEIKNAQIAMEEEAASEVEEIRDKLVEALKNKYEKMREGEISDLDKEIERLQKQLEDLDKQSDDKKGRLAKLKAEMDAWSKDDSPYGKSKVEELKQQIAELEREIQKDEIQQSIDDLEKEKDKIDEHYDNLLSDKNIYKEANNLLSTKSQEELLAMLTEFAPDYAHIGELWGKSFADEFKKQVNEAKEALDFLNGKKKPTAPPKPPTPTNPKPSTGGGSNKPSTPKPTPPKTGDRVKVTNKDAVIYATSTTSKSSGKWGKVGRTDFKIANMNGNRVALSPNGKFPATGWIDKKHIAKFSKGGLTGLWNDMNGKLGKMAELHSGEAILNKDQAKIFYDDSTANAFENFVKMLPNLSNLIPSLGKTVVDDESVEQNVEINITINCANTKDGFEMKRTGDTIASRIVKELKNIGMNKRSKR